MPHDKKLAEAEDFLAKHPDVANIELLIPDMCGVLRGKRLTRDSFSKLFEGQVRAPGSIYLLDATGQSVPTIHYGIADGDPDYYCHAVPGTLKPVPWSDRPLGQVMASMHHEDGTPLAWDPRAVLGSVLSRFEEMGLTPTVAIELEFYLLDQEPGPDGLPRPAFSSTSGYRQSTTQVYGIDELYDFEAFLDQVDDACQVLDIPAEAATSEYGAGQYEINLHYLPDALKACDQAVLLKRTIKAVARRNGLLATFMAKPFEESAGNGLHIHISLRDKDGRNVFAANKEDTVLGIPAADALHHAVGGLIKTMPECMAIFAPNANSYRRFRPGVYAPVTPSWGINNRSAAIRVPPSDAGALRVEHRNAGADANPYLAAAAVLAGIHYGITSKVKPPEISEGDADPEDLPVLPLNWWGALDKFHNARVLPEYLGREYCELYEACRRFECDSYHARIQSLDYEWYLRTV